MKTDKTLTELLIMFGERTLEELNRIHQNSKAPAKVRQAALTWIKALGGNRDCINLIWDRLEGRVPPAKPEVPPREKLDDELQRVIDRVYGASEDDQMPKRAD